MKKSSLKLDPFSLLATIPVSWTLRRAQEELKSLGYRLSYQPTKKGTLTLRKILELRIPNRWAIRYGEIDDLCVRLKAVRKSHILTTRNVPRSATGPDFKKILIGSGRKYGRILEATFAVIPLPETSQTLKVQLPKALSRDKFLKRFWGSGIRPRLFVARERSRFHIELEGSEEIVAAERSSLERALTP